MFDGCLNGLHDDLWLMLLVADFMLLLLRENLPGLSAFVYASMRMQASMQTSTKPMLP